MFALGMCMALIPEWNAFKPGVIMGVIRVVVLLLMVFVWRRMENKEPIKLSGKTIGATLIGIIGALLLGVGMCLTMVWSHMIAVPGMVSNIIFALFNGVIGITSHSAWFGTLSAYYILLSIMRVGVVRQERKLAGVKEKQEHMSRELSVYRRNSILFIFLAVVLAGAVVLLLHAQGGKEYPGLTIYAVATYTFYKITMSSIQVVKVGKRKSPLLLPRERKRL